MSKKIYISVFLLCSSMAMSAPKLEVDNDIDLGLLPRELILNRTITYKNIGNEKLIIIKWGKSCGCMNVEMGKTQLEPGESSKFVVTIDAGIFIPGNVKVTFHSNDPAVPKQIVRLKYAFYDPLIVSPPILYVEKKKDERLLANIFVGIRDLSVYSDYDIKKVISSEKKIAVKKTKIEKNKFKLSIPFDAKINKNLDFQIEIVPTDNKFGNYVIPVKMRIAPKVRFYPKKLILQKKKKTSKGDLLSKFRILMETPKEISEIKAALGILDFKYIKTNKNEYLVECFSKDDIDFQTKYIEHFIVVLFENDSEEYILPFLYVNRGVINKQTDN